MKKILLVLTVGLLSCKEGAEINEKESTYSIKVNYIGTGLQIPPSDTISFSSRNKPSLYIHEGVSCLIGDDTWTPEAANVRSFNILSVK